MRVFVKTGRSEQNADSHRCVMKLVPPRGSGWVKALSIFDLAVKTLIVVS